MSGAKATCFLFLLVPFFLAFSSSPLFPTTQSQLCAFFSNFLAPFFSFLGPLSFSDPGIDSYRRSVVSSSTSASGASTLVSSDIPLNVRRLRKGPSTSGPSSAESVAWSIHVGYNHVPDAAINNRTPYSSTTTDRSSSRGLLRFTRRPGGLSDPRSPFCPDFRVHFCYSNRYLTKLKIRDDYATAKYSNILK